MNQFEQLKEEVAKSKLAIFGPIEELLTAAEDDSQKYYGKGVKSAGNRLKKKLQDVRKAIKFAEVKSQLSAVQTFAKDYRASLTEEIKTK